MKCKYIFILFMLFTVSTFAQENIMGVIGSGGGTATNENYRVTGTAGLPVIGQSINSEYRHSAGFWYIQNVRIVSDVVTEYDQIPLEFNLQQNYPNPFNPSTTISFALPQKEHVELRIYDMLGREIATLVSKDLNAGRHEVVFDAGNLSSGVYFYRIQAGNFSQLRKLILVK